MPLPLTHAPRLGCIDKEKVKRTGSQHSETLELSRQETVMTKAMKKPWVKRPRASQACVLKETHVTRGSRTAARGTQTGVKLQVTRVRSGLARIS